MTITLSRLLTVLAAVLLAAGCASKPRQFMPTPVLYQETGTVSAVVEPDDEIRGGSTDVDLLFIADRAPETAPESTLPMARPDPDPLPSARLG